MTPSASIDHGAPFRGACWRDVSSLRVVRPELDATMLLHAGPPLHGAPPPAMLNAAVQAVLFETGATDEAAARELVLQGVVRLAPAQDHGVATPLAQVVSASMPLAVVAQRGQITYAPLLEGTAPALRFGCAARECRERLHEMGAWALRVIAPILRREPIAIDALVRDAVAAGDDCHARTAACNEALIGRLHGLDAEGAVRMRRNPAFVLPVLMAAAAAALRSHRCRIEAIGGNGIEFGVRGAAERRWVTAAAAAPCGTRVAGFEETAPLGAIGDSALIDFCGLGGQAFDAARREALLDPASGICDPQRIGRGRVGPLINLAILGGDAAGGLIGRGHYGPPVSLFAQTPGSPGR